MKKTQWMNSSIAILFEITTFSASKFIPIDEANVEKTMVRTTNYRNGLCFSRGDIFVTTECRNLLFVQIFIRWYFQIDSIIDRSIDNF